MDVTEVLGERTFRLPCEASQYLEDIVDPPNPRAIESHFGEPQDSSGAVIVEVDATQLLQDTTHISIPELQDVSTTHYVTHPLSSTSSISIGGGARMHKGNGNARAGVVFTARPWNPVFCEGRCFVDSETGFNSSALFHSVVRPDTVVCAGGGLVSNTVVWGVRWMHAISPRLAGSVRWQLRGLDEAGLQLKASYLAFGSKFRFDTELTNGPMNGGVSWCRKLSPRLSISSTIRISEIATPVFNIGFSRVVNETMTFGNFLSWAPNGITLNLRLGCRSHVVEIPLRLSIWSPFERIFSGHSFALSWAASLLLPVAVDFGVKSLVVLPISRRFHERELQRVRECAKADIADGFERASRDIPLLLAAAESSYTTELSCENGIVIESAHYGPLFTLHDIECMPHDMRERYTALHRQRGSLVDVVVAVRSLVSEAHQLSIAAGPKSHVRGFCDPCPGLSKGLLLKWTYKTQSHVRVFADDCPVVLPVE